MPPPRTGRAAMRGGGAIAIFFPMPATPARRFRSRYRRILRFFARVFAAELWWEILLPRVGLGALGRRGRGERLRREAAAFRRLAVRMGGVLIKVGQFLSARVDVLPREITGELSSLQDEVGAESFEEIRGVIEAEFGVPLAERFVDFEPQPMASASIGQVHYARLCRSSPDGEPCPRVVVKVQRPAIGEIVEADLAAIAVVGRWLTRLKSVRRHANVPGLIEEFSRSLHEEIDYLHEGKNAEQFGASFRDRPEVRVPEVVWSHTTTRVLTLQDVGAIKIGDYPGLEAAGIPRAAVASRLLDAYLKQIFEDGFFHADPHPGNLFVLPAPAGGEPGAWRLVFIDFGMTGTLGPAVFDGLKEALIAAGTRDARRLVASFKKLDLLLPGADLELIERATREVLERVWGKSTREITAMGDQDVSQLTEEFGDLFYQMPFQLPENLILLGRCLGILSGLATGLDPDFKVWTALVPYAQKLAKDQGEGGLSLVLKQLVDAARVLAGLPGRADSLVDRIERGRLEVRIPEMQRYVARLERGARKLGGSVVFAAGLLAATAFYLSGKPELALGVSVAEAALLLWLLLGR